MPRWLAFALALLLLLASPLRATAQDVLPVPALTARVIDQTGTLDASAQAALEAQLAAFEKKAGSQIVVLLVPTTAPEDIAAYAQRIADNWKIGRREVGDGLLIVVAKNDRRVRIEVAKALEGAVPDLAARQIIDRAMQPAFRAGDFTGGLSAAVDRLAERITGEGLPAPSQRSPRGGGAEGFGFGFESIAIFFLVAVPVIGTVFTGMMGRRLGSMVTGGAVGGIGWLLTASVLAGVGAGVLALILVGLLGFGSAGRRGRGGTFGPPIIWGGGGGGGGWGGGGGGFSSGGGGDFGGGGASGGW